MVCIFAITLANERTEGGREFPQCSCSMESNVRDKLREITSRLDDLQTTNTELKDTTDALKSTNVDLTSRVNALQSKNINLETRNKGFEARIDTLLNLTEHLRDASVNTGLKQSDNVDKRLLTSSSEDLHSIILQLQQLTTRVDTINNKFDDTHGNVYTRWGRSTCPNVHGTELVYSGYAGGSWYDHTGAAAQYLCMPQDPDFLPDQSGYGRVYGVEYQQNFNSITYQQDGVCAVCKSTRTSVLMVPGHLHCRSGWVREYVGILVSGFYGDKAATEYVCLDSAPETELNSSSNDNGALWHYVNSKCGSLPCPPYKDEGTLPCVVCSK